MLVLDASMWVGGGKGWKEKGMAELGALRREKPGKRSVSRLRIQDTLSCISIRIEIQKPTKLPTQELENNVAWDGPQNELTNWQLSSKGWGWNSEQTDQPNGIKCKQDRAGGRLLGSKWILWGDEGGNCSLSSNEGNCIPPSWQSFQLSQDPDLWGTLFYPMPAKNSWVKMWLTREPLSSIGFSFWTELRDSLLSLILVKNIIWGRMGWWGELCKGRLKGITFLEFECVGITLCGWGTLRSCQKGVGKEFRSSIKNSLPEYCLLKLLLKVSINNRTDSFFTY